MVNSWDEAWLADHLRKRQTQPAKDVRLIQFTLAKPLPLLNTLLRTHWARRRDMAKALSAEVYAAAQAQLPREPWQRARITIERHSLKEPDVDGLSPKHLLDVLQPRSTRHPWGLGVIWNDDPAHLEQSIVHVKAATRKDQKTVVRLERLR